MKVRKVIAKQLLLQALGVVCNLDSQAGNAVLLTFDDGPHPDITPGVLDRLKQYHARAVFFVVGSRIPRAPILLSKICADGHILGNHTYAHWLNQIPLAEQYIEDVRACQEVIQTLTGHRPRLFRPALGRVTSGSLAAARHHRLRTIYWSIDSGDWKLRKKEDALELGKQLCHLVGSRDILLFHDDNTHVLTVLDVLLPSLVERGFDLQSAVRGL